VDAVVPNLPDFFTAIQEQLGLKLESTKGPVGCSCDRPYREADARLTTGECHDVPHSACSDCCDGVVVLRRHTLGRQCSGGSTSEGPDGYRRSRQSDCESGWDVQVSMTQLEADIQQRLRPAGLTIVAGQAPRPFGTQGDLWANVTIIRSSPASSQWFLPTSVTLSGSVVLAGSNERAEAITWATERFQVVDTPQIHTRLREDLNFLIDDFSKAYRSANPR
jgi:hypothetical protein